MPDKHAYHEYIEEHIDNVKKVWKDVQLSLTGEYWLDDCTWQGIKNQIDVHDFSKYNDSEFNGYCQWFYPTDPDSKDKGQFDIAWNHHQKKNPHHWEYWILWTNCNPVPLNMPFNYVFEMLCDWTAMSYKFKDTPSEFYDSKKDTMFLSEGTKAIIKMWLPLFDKLIKQHEEVSQ